jgi:hypothetical protein
MYNISVEYKPYMDETKIIRFKAIITVVGSDETYGDDITPDLNILPQIINHGLLNPNSLSKTVETKGYKDISILKKWVNVFYLKSVEEIVEKKRIKVLEALSIKSEMVYVQI